MAEEHKPEGQCPFMCSQTRCVCLPLHRPKSFIQQGQKIDKDEIKYHDIFSTFLVKQKIKQAQFYCQNVNLFTALGKADSGAHRRSGLMLLLAVPSFLLEMLTELLPNQRGIFNLGKTWVKGWRFIQRRKARTVQVTGWQTGWVGNIYPKMISPSAHERPLH